MTQQATSAKHLCCSNAPSARFRGLPGCVAGRAGSARRWSLAHSTLGRSAGLESRNVQLVLWRAGPAAADPMMDSQVYSPVAPCAAPKGAPAAHLASGIALRSCPVLPSAGPAAFGQRAGCARVLAAPERPPWQRMVACHPAGASRQSASTCCAVVQKTAACHSVGASHQSAPTCCAAVSWQVGEDALHWRCPKRNSPSERRWR